MTLSFHDYRNARRAARQRQRIARIGSVNGHPLWSEDEDRTLRRLYPDYAAARKQLPHRTRWALRSRAQYLGVQNELHTWTNDELGKLRRVFPVATRQELLAAFPGRALSAIAKRANRKHISRRRSLRKSGDPLLDAIRDRARNIGYSLSDVDEVAHTKHFFERDWKSYPHPVYECLYRAVEALDGEMLPPIDTPVPDRFLPRLPPATSLARVPLRRDTKRKCSSRDWSPRDDATLAKHFPDYAALSKALPKRSRSAIVNRASRRCLSPHRKHWTAGEVSRLRKLYGWAPVETLLGAFPGRSLGSIKHIAHENELRRPGLLKPIGHPLIRLLAERSTDPGLFNGGTRASGAVEKVFLQHAIWLATHESRSARPRR
jgi:hypothetical protein